MNTTNFRKPNLILVVLAVIISTVLLSAVALTALFSTFAPWRM